MNINKNLHISLRRFRSEKTNTLISLSGLVLAMGIVTLILVFILNELNYNSFYKNKDRIYRIINYNKVENKQWATTPFVIGSMVKEQLSGIEAVAHQYNITDAKFLKNNEFIAEQSMLSTESSFFKIFGVEILQGSLNNFDKTADKILLSSKLAHKYFGKENAIGKNLKVKIGGNEYDLQVAAIFENIPPNTSVKANCIVNIDMAFNHLQGALISNGKIPNKKQMKEAWDGIFFTNYLLLGKEVSINNFETSLLQFGEKHSTNRVKLTLSLQSLNDIYFKSKGIIDNHNRDSGNKNMLYILGSIGLLILLIACVNYLNLASAQAMIHLKTFAVRKTYGASQKDLFRQLIFDYCLLSLFALPFAMGLAQISLPFISKILGKSYILRLDNEFIIGIGILLFLTFLTGLLTATMIYFRFTRAGIVNMLKGEKNIGSHRFSLQKIMIVFQILVFIVLLSGSIIIQKQVRYAFNKDLGFVKEGLLYVPIGDRNKEILQQEIIKNPNVQAVSAAMWLPPSNNKMYITIPRVDKPDEKIAVIGLFADYNFAKTLGLKILMGDDFDINKFQSGVLVNQSAVKALGLTDIIGEKTTFGTIRGMIADFHMYSFREEIPPMLFCLSPQSSRQMAIRINTKDIHGTIDYLKNVWENSEGSTPFNFKFTDDVLNDIYLTDIKFSGTIGLLSLIAILIACLGLIGLSLFSCKQKTKEIGIRKSNGAKTFEIVRMLNRDFLRLVVIAFALACPISWYVMNKWLQNFAYKTELSWWIFVLAGIIAMGIALLTVSLQSWKAARRNPVESLRYE
eukprot:TRINITY_DN2376_c0_g1_i1.p1 TRINITY_DN2376_c0_g1~~TRINITY_DN2376_c0_g1_i1.p1  ORF type:complete len:796 (+),score=18.75 TRINITY_DN2376_c0_g1_i1:2546-4933(+)